MILNPGDKVVHPHYGKGTVLMPVPWSNLSLSINVHYGSKGNHYSKASKLTKL